MLSLNEWKLWMGFARLFQPTYAGADMGHPDSFVWSDWSSSYVEDHQQLSPALASVLLSPFMLSRVEASGVPPPRQWVSRLTA
jgi:hypothetical protein